VNIVTDGYRDVAKGGSIEHTTCGDRVMIGGRACVCLSVKWHYHGDMEAECISLHADRTFPFSLASLENKSICCHFNHGKGKWQSLMCQSLILTTETLI